MSTTTRETGSLPDGTGSVAGVWAPQDAAIGRRECALVLLAAVVLSLIGFSPYLYAYLATPPDRYYLGFVLNTKDQNTYFMWLRQVAEGHILLRNLYTSVPHDGAMLNLFFLAFGQPARFFGWSLDACYQFARICSSVTLAASVYAFAALFTRRGARRWMMWAAVLFAAGFGWITALAAWWNGNYGLTVSDHAMQYKPVDTWVPEAFPWFSLLIMPHLAMGLGLLLLAVRWLAIGMLGDNWRASLSAGITLAILSFVHPYDVIVFFALMGGLAAWMVIHERTCLVRTGIHLLLIGTLGLPPVLYNYRILHGNPGMTAWLVQNISLSPPASSYLLGFGLPLILSTIWLAQFLRHEGRGRTPMSLLAIWIALAPLLLYAPVAFQRRLAIGLGVPLAAAMACLLFRWMDAPGHALRRRACVAGVIACACLTSLFHWANAFRKATDLAGENYITQHQRLAITRIPNGAAGGTVLSGFLTGNRIPRFTSRAVVVGSRGQTQNFDATLADVQRFYRGDMTVSERSDFLERRRVEFIVYGDAERSLDPHKRLAACLNDAGWAELSEAADETRVFRAPSTPSAARARGSWYAGAGSRNETR